jgi:hypothetical protein
MFCSVCGVKPDSQRCELPQGLIFRFHPGQFINVETEFRQVIIVDDLLRCLGGPCFQVKFLGRGTVDYNAESWFDQFRVVA